MYRDISRYAISMYYIIHDQLLVIKCWGEYGYHEGYGTGIRVLMLNVLATADGFMSVDCKPSKLAYGRL